MDLGELRLLDEIAAAATVAPIEADLDGWWCKAAPDLPFRRCNVAMPPPDAAHDRARFLAELDAVRAWYHGHGLRLIVQVSTALDGWEDVDAWLADTGLAVEAPVDLMVAGPEPTCDHCAAEAIRNVTVTDGIDVDWARTFGRIHGDDDRQRDRAEAYGRMLSALGDRALGASRAIDGQVAGIGLGVLDRGWLGIFGMGTAPQHRRQGIATDVVWALRARAAERGIERAYLQVEVDNAPAIDLYQDVGFERSHGYHYRSEGEDPTLGC